jgi:hypothetical protein
MGNGRSARAINESAKQFNRSRAVVNAMFLVFISSFPLFIVLAFPGSSLLSGQFQSFTEVLREGRREVTRKVGKPADYPPSPSTRGATAGRQRMPRMRETATEGTFYVQIKVLNRR